MAETPDRERALAASHLFEDFCGILNDCQRSLFERWVADAMLEFAAAEVEGIWIDCTCAPYWKELGKRDPTCEAHDLEDQMARRAEQLRAQKFGRGE